MTTSKGIVYFGFGNEDGSWRIMRDSDSNDLLVQLRVDGSWVTQSRFTPQTQEPPPPPAITKTVSDSNLSNWNDVVVMIPWHLTVSASENLNAWADKKDDTGDPSSYSSQYDSNASNWADAIVTIPTQLSVNVTDGRTMSDAIATNGNWSVTRTGADTNVSKWLDANRIGWGLLPSDTNESNWTDAVAEQHPDV